MFEILKSHFNRLDNADVSAESIFKTEQDKERYETLLMYVFRKFEATNYHLKNVKGFIEKEKASLDASDQVSKAFGNIKASQVTFRYIQTSDEYIYELSAFLEALKSSLDLLAEVCSFYLPGVTTNYSISPLLKLVGKGKTGPIYDEIMQNLTWLSILRKYRHHLVHRLMPSVRSGYKTQRLDKKTAKVYYPVVVPEKTPAFVTDTRASRIMEEMMRDDDDDGLPGLYFGTSVGKITNSDGTEEVIHFSIDAGPSAGYKPVDEFMKEHINNYENFFGQIIQTLENLNFKPVPKS